MNRRGAFAACLLLFLLCVQSCAQNDGDDEPALDGDREAFDREAQDAQDGETMALWRPSLAISWQWQLDTPVDTSLDVAVYDIDLFENEAEVVSALHAAGRKVICYVSVGSYEDWRPDQASFPKEIIGKEYEGWAGEKWLDIRRLDLLGPIIAARLDACRDKGFDAVEPDNIDGYTNDTGFPLTAEDQEIFNRWLVEAAHARGLSIGMKNDPDQVEALVSLFDWALTEDCYAEGWCDRFLPFLDAGKAVFMAEYTDTQAKKEQFCPYAAKHRFSPILKRRDLDAWREACP